MSTIRQRLEQGITAGRSTISALVRLARTSGESPRAVPRDPAPNRAARPSPGRRPSRGAVEPHDGKADVVALPRPSSRPTPRKTFTLEQAEDLARRLREWPDLNDPRRRLNKQEAIGNIKDVIATLQLRGYTLEEITQLLVKEGMPITLRVLKVYLHRAKVRDRIARRQRRQLPLVLRGHGTRRVDAAAESALDNVDSEEDSPWSAALRESNGSHALGDTDEPDGSDAADASDAFGTAREI
jgi:hypothetical protein